MVQEWEQQSTEQAQQQPAEVTDQKKSKAPLIIVFVVILVVTLVIVSVLFLKDRFVSSNKIDKKTLNTACKQNDKNICNFIDKLNKIENISVKTTANDVRGGKLVTTTQIQGKYKHSEIKSYTNEQPAIEIVVDDYEYQKDNSDGKWWRSPSRVDSGAVPTPVDPTSPTSPEVFGLVINDHGLENTTFQEIGTEICGNLTCLKYQVFDVDWTDTKKYVWFDTKDYLPRKTVEYYNDSSASLTTEAIITYDNIKITEPSPVKEKPVTECRPPDCIR